MKATGHFATPLISPGADPGTPGTLAERDANRGMEDPDAEIIPWYDPAFEAKYGHGANRNPSIDRALQRRLRAPTVHALRHGGKLARSMNAYDERIAGVAPRCRSTAGATGRALDEHDAALARRARRSHSRETRVWAENERRHVYALGTDTTRVAAALVEEYGGGSEEYGAVTAANTGMDSALFDDSDDTETESVVSFVHKRRPRADRTPASDKRTHQVWAALSPREKNEKVTSPRDGLRERYEVNYFAALRLEEACRPPPMRYQDPALTMDATQAARYREAHPEQFTALLPGDERIEEVTAGGMWKKAGAAARLAAEIGDGNDDDASGAPARDIDAPPASTPRRTPSPKGTQTTRKMKPVGETLVDSGRPERKVSGGPATDESKGRTKGATPGPGSRATKSVKSAGSATPSARAPSVRAPSLRAPSVRAPSVRAPPDSPPNSPPPPPALDYGSVRLLELMWDPDACPGGLPFSLANADKLARQNTAEGVERIRAWCRLIGVDAGGKPNGAHLCGLLRGKYREAMPALEAHVPGIRDAARTAEEMEAGEHNGARGGTERRGADDGRKGWAAALCAKPKKKASEAPDKKKVSFARVRG